MKPHMKTEESNNSDITLDLWVPFRMWMIADKIGRHIHGIYGPDFKISRVAWRALLVLANCAPLSAGELAERSGMDPTRVSHAMKELQKRRMISRRIHPEDRRKTILQLTRTGMKVYEQIWPHAKAAEQQALATLTKEEKNTLLTLLTKMESQTNTFFGNTKG